MKVEVRPIPLSELATFDEAGACGTAAVISPIRKIVNDITGEECVYCTGNEPGPVSVKLYEHLVAIQNGDEEDPFGWTTVL